MTASRSIGPGGPEGGRAGSEANVRAWGGARGVSGLSSEIGAIAGVQIWQGGGFRPSRTGTGRPCLCTAPGFTAGPR